MSNEKYQYVCRPRYFEDVLFILHNWKEDGYPNSNWLWAQGSKTFFDGDKSKYLLVGSEVPRIYVVHSISFHTFFVQAFKIIVDSWKFTVIAIHLMRWLANFYDFRFKWTATEGIGIHSTTTWLSQLVNFKNVIWIWGHFRRMTCNKILF